jgi:APA family basic amino acid/polyamine antiporter
LRADENRAPRIVAVTGLAGCVVLAFSLPVASVIAGCVVLAIGAALWAVRRAR